MENKKVLLSCGILTGAFSGERIFKLGSDNNTYTGVTSYKFCRNNQKKKIGITEPNTETTIDGFIEAYLLEILEDGVVKVSIPDGEIILIHKSLMEDKCLEE